MLTCNRFSDPPEHTNAEWRSSLHAGNHVDPVTNVLWSGWFQTSPDNGSPCALLVISNASGAADLAVYNEKDNICNIFLRICPRDLRQTVAARFSWPFNARPSSYPNRLALAKGCRLCIYKLPEYSKIIEAFDTGSYSEFNSLASPEKTIDFNSGIVTIDWDIPHENLVCYLTDGSVTILHTSDQYNQLSADEPFMRLCCDALSTSLALGHMKYDKPLHFASNPTNPPLDRPTRHIRLQAVATSLFSGMKLSLFSLTSDNKTKNVQGSGSMYILTNQVPLILGFPAYETDALSQRISLEELHRLIMYSVDCSLSRISLLLKTEAGLYYRLEMKNWRVWSGNV